MFQPERGTRMAKTKVAKEPKPKYFRFTAEVLVQLRPDNPCYEHPTWSKVRGMLFRENEEVAFWMSGCNDGQLSPTAMAVALGAIGVPVVQIETLLHQYHDGF